ncbi:unnamed protein product [Clavelina lepadiformis]|uniref:Uncharacterized protein n=1 Tax=Clavelina lepadiformis TaxID=159417 RepID=A0ABP0EV64_CLALP
MASVIEDEVTCPICLEILSKPIRMLSCGHNICQVCLLELCKSSKKDARCPTCRNSIGADYSKVEEIPRNRTLENVIEKLEQKAEEERKNSVKKPPAIPPKISAPSFAPTSAANPLVLPHPHSGLSHPATPNRQSSSLAPTPIRLQPLTRRNTDPKTPNPKQRIPLPAPPVPPKPDKFLASPVILQTEFQPTSLLPVQLGQQDLPSVQPAQTPHVGGVRDLTCYFENLDRVKAESILKDRAKNGEFLIRDSGSGPGQYCLSARAPSGIIHIKVVQEPRNGNWKMGEMEFQSMAALVDRLTENKISLSGSHKKLSLTKPLLASR